MAGYWAETHIFGGVLLFDRGEGEDEVSPGLQILFADQSNHDISVQRRIHTQQQVWHPRPTHRGTVQHPHRLSPLREPQLQQLSVTHGYHPRE